MSVFKVGVGFRLFFRFFKKSVRFSVSVFQNTAVSVSVCFFLENSKFSKLSIGTLYWHITTALCTCLNKTLPVHDFLRSYY